MKHNKKNNQYYGNLFECCFADCINKNNNYCSEYINEKNIEITKEEIDNIYSDAKDAISKLNIKTNKCLRIGNHTQNENGDLIINEEVYELKYVSSGNGTYLNTSIEYFKKIGGPDFREYINKYICPILEEEYGEKVYNNLSPVSLVESKDIRHNHLSLYNRIKNADKKARSLYVNDLYNFFVSNPLQLCNFYLDIISKNISQKEKPNNIIVYNYITKEANFINLKEKESFEKIKLRKTNLGFVINNFRIQIGWQNGNGLNNPTIRAFIK